MTFQTHPNSFLPFKFERRALGEIGQTTSIKSSNKLNIYDLQVILLLKINQLTQSFKILTKFEGYILILNPSQCVRWSISEKMHIESPTCEFLEDNSRTYVNVIYKTSIHVEENENIKF